MEEKGLRYWECVRECGSVGWPSCQWPCRSPPLSGRLTFDRRDSFQVPQMELLREGAVSPVCQRCGTWCQISIPKLKLVCTCQAGGVTARSMGVGTGDHFQLGRGQFMKQEGLCWLLTEEGDCCVGGGEGGPARRRITPGWGMWQRARRVL